MIPFQELLQKRRGANFKAPSRLLALDPGHTTGWSLFVDGKLVDSGQCDTVINRRGQNEGDISWTAVNRLFFETRPDVVVCEDYRVYAHKLDRHTNSQVLTLRIIGALEYICFLGYPNKDGCTHDSVPITYQMAATAKGFCDDKKLKDWGFYDVAQRHSRDSIRHAVYYLLFDKELPKLMDKE